MVLFAYNTVLEVTKKRNIPGYMVLMDVEKAFDSMDHDFLLEVWVWVKFHRLDKNNINKSGELRYDWG